MQLELYTEGDASLVVTQDQALEIELQLNLLPEGRLWRELGDTLYKFHTKFHTTQQTPNRCYVTPEQFAFVQDAVKGTVTEGTYEK